MLQIEKRKIMTNEMLQQVQANPDQWVAYFGYGSLVNDDTRNQDSFGIAGRLPGFRRNWTIWTANGARKMFGFDGIAALSASKDPLSAIDGLLIFDRKDHLPRVDKRESRYDRINLDPGTFETDEKLPEGVDTYIYLGWPADTMQRDPAMPILQSYCDAVMQGFLHKFGEDGLMRFVRETSGWDIPVIMDREQPFYPRHITLSDKERAQVDAALEAASATCVPLSQESRLGAQRKIG